MFGIGGNELAVILLFAFLLFGPDKLPQMGRTIGRALRQFNETREKLTNVVQTEVVDPMAAAAKAPNAPKKSDGTATGATADVDDLDADIADKAIDEMPRRKETFAERRARLAAEKAEREAAVATASDDSAVSEGTEASSVDAEPATDTAVSDAAATDAAPVEAEEVRTTADLYARRPRHRASATSSNDTADTATEGGEQ